MKYHLCPYIIHGRFQVDLRCDTTGDNLHLLEVNSGHKTRVNKMVNLYSYLGRVRSPVVDPDKVEQAATGKKKVED